MTKSISFPEPEEKVREFIWTLDRYHRAIELGLLTENDRIELLFGKLIEKMPVGKAHAACLSKLNMLFHQRYMGKYDLRRENPVSLPNESEPEPDFVVSYFREDFYNNGHPTPPDILVVIEVADSTLYTDRQIKASAYAFAGIKEYWILNVKHRKVELYLNPDVAEGNYTSIVHYEEDASFDSPFAGKVLVKDLIV